LSTGTQWISRRNIVLGIVLFALALAGARAAWIGYFHQPGQPLAEDGVLDLRGWSGGGLGTIPLDGVWTFYPGRLLTGGETVPGSADRPIRVPGSWSGSLRPDETRESGGGGGAFGYGSYRLRVLVDPKETATYGIRVPSVRSASALYVNGRPLAGSGDPSPLGEGYKAGNVPYTASFAADGLAEIEVIVQAANYKDIRNGGIVRSIKFGSEAAVARETQLSVSMQQLSAVVFLLHAGYALVLYFIGTREKRLLYFALLTFGAMMMDALGSGEKVLHQFVPIGYDWGFKLVHLAMAAVAFSLLQCVSHQLPAILRKLAPPFFLLCGAAALLALALPARLLLTIQPLFVGALAASVLATITSMLRASAKDVKDNVLMLLSLIAFASNFAWWGLSMAAGVKVLYYPFDLIVSTACFSSVWFNHYFQVHAETKKLAAKLQRADKTKDRFLANTSHELRNPLHGILNISQGVLDRERLSMKEESVKDMEIVLSVGRRMSFILNDLLDAMSLKVNAPRLRYGAFSIHAIATGVFDMLQWMREGTPVRLSNDIPERFPRVYADENRVIQIVFNLLHNAVKFTSEGTVSIRAEEKDGKACVTVADTGIGIDEETLKRLFEPYEQAGPEHTMVEGGFGLGLSICKQLLDLHGETLRVRSEPGRGSEFVFTLRLAADADPAAEEEREAENSERTAREEAAASSAGGREEAGFGRENARRPAADRPRILLVDDDPVNLKVLESILSHEHYDMTPVTGAGQALELLDEREWDLIVSDVMLPRMSGYELTRAIRERYSISELPVLLITARSQPEDIAYGFQSGANEYVTKPVEALELRSRVKALTDVKRSVRDRLRLESAWLQAQIQPHFLFNTLTAIRALSEIDLDRMRNLLEAFGNHMRDKFKLQNIDGPVPIEEELSVVRSYLQIEQERYEDRLRVSWEIGDCRSVRLPLLTIQPLVENAIRHGVMKRSDGGRIAIRATDYGTHAEIEVEDDGVGMDDNPLQGQENEPDMGAGVGLINTDLRLKRLYGSGLRVKSLPGRGTSISFVVYPTVPFKTRESR